MLRFASTAWLAAVILCSASALAQTATITEWPVPTPNSEPLHIVAASTTVAYFTESQANKIGELNTSTNTFSEWTLPSHSMPHGILLSASGTVVICAINGDYLGFLNPTTNAGTGWLLPNPNSGPSHLDISGTSYFLTESNGNRIGLLNPSAKTITEWLVPTANSNPWGIAVGAGTQVFFIERAAKQLAMLDTSVNQITEWPLAPLTGVEHLKFVNGILYFGDINSSYVATFDPSMNLLTYWQAPTGLAEIPEVFVNNGLINFTERRGNNIAVLDPTMQVGATATPTPVVTPVVPTTTTIVSERGTIVPSITPTVMPTTTMVNGQVNGGFTEWQVPTPMSQPFGIYIFDGVTFFTEFLGDKVATLTTP